MKTVEEKKVKIIEEINQHIENDMKAIEAIALVLSESTLANSHKEQIRQEVLRKDQGFLRSCSLTFGVIA